MALTLHSIILLLLKILKHTSTGVFLEHCIMKEFIRLLLSLSSILWCFLISFSWRDRLWVVFWSSFNLINFNEQGALNVDDGYCVHWQKQTCSPLPVKVATETAGVTFRRLLHKKRIPFPECPFPQWGLRFQRLWWFTVGASVMVIYKRQRGLCFPTLPCKGVRQWCRIDSCWCWKSESD